MTASFLGRLGRFRTSSEMMACSAPSMGSFTALPPVAIRIVFACSNRHNWQKQFDETSHAIVLPQYHAPENSLQPPLRLSSTSADNRWLFEYAILSVGASCVVTARQYGCSVLASMAKAQLYMHAKVGLAPPHQARCRVCNTSVHTEDRFDGDMVGFLCLQ